MRSYCRFFSLLLIVLLWGCGGSGIGVLPGDTKSVYAGIYVGSFAIVNGDSGTLSLNVTDNGTIFGTITNDVIQKTGPFNGVVRQDGKFKATYHYADYETVIYQGTGLFTASGSTINGVLNLSRPNNQMLNMVLKTAP